MDDSPAPSASQAATNSAYWHLKTLSDSLRDAALCADWEHFIELGQTYISAFEAISKNATQADISEEARKIRIKLLLEILDNDVLIKALATPEMARVSSLLTQTSKKKAAIRAYHEQHRMPDEI